MVNLAFLPKMSVIIPIHNGESDLLDLLVCLRSQSYPRDCVEYLLIDNNSCDQTPNLLAQAAENARVDGFPLKVLSEPDIQSSYAARNKGIGAATGEFLLFTDADCRPAPGWVEKMAQAFRDPTIGIVVGELNALPGNSILEHYAQRCQMMSQHFLVEHPFCPYGQTANLGIRQLALNRVGLFRPLLTTGGDADICWRIQRETNWKLTTAPQAIVLHRHRHQLTEIYRQWHRYGRSNRYLHELHGVPLMDDLTLKKGVYRISRWLFKELPKVCLNLIKKKANPIDLVMTPIDLILYQARTTGQKQVKLPPKFRHIPPMDLENSAGNCEEVAQYTVARLSGETPTQWHREIPSVHPRRR